MIAVRGRRGRVLAVLLVCLVVVAAQVLMEDGPLIVVDFAVQRLGLEQRWPDLYPLAKAFELLGQRGLVYAIAVVIIGVVAWLRRTWRPMIVLVGSLLTLNIVVGATKILTGRRKPFTGDIGVFEGGIIFPSGHAANVVLVWGVVCYLLLRYSRWRFRRRTMTAWVVTASIAMASASVYLNTHWVTDLVAGWLVGALILEGAVLIDTRVAAWRAPPAQQRPPVVTHRVRVSSAARELNGARRAKPLVPVGAPESSNGSSPAQRQPTQEVHDG